ncbi:restriction endonuclease [Paenibacillus sp. N1-5-1-14]|uniref:restriction endonuclease n=1 Tax=Paenibacillus radicibacter TaxID=2972488 RepID=UPI002158DBCF|nr:restriction endonuclease [Paenibacillus radicibacter]MCR8643430.1 restriction endonuclease [Paenibacillus radicibacter]
MARRKKKQAIHEMLIETGIKLVVGITFFEAMNFILIKKYLGNIMFPMLVNVLLISLAVILVIAIAITIANRQSKLERANIQEIDSMSGTMFERYLERYFKKQGWQVKRTGGQGDYGADLILTSTNKKVVIQAKRWQKNVGYEAIQQAYTSKDVYKCDEAWVITNSGFTEQAREGAKKLGVSLWDREYLIAQLANIHAATTLKTDEITQPSKESSSENNSVDRIEIHTCAVCHKPVSEKVKQFCISQSKRFNNKIYCYDHQRQA